MAPTTDTSPITLCSFGRYCHGDAVNLISNWTGGGNNVYPTANLALAFPLVVPYTYISARAFWANGSAVAGNVDVGLYDTSFNLLAHTGNQAQATINVLQFSALSFTLNPGTYYLAISASSAAAVFISYTGLTAAELQIFGALQMATANPLPATFTPAAPANAYYPLFGITRSSGTF